MSHNRRNTAFLAVVALAAAGPLIAQSPAADTAKARPDTAKAAPDTTPKITFDGYVDGYYAWDFDRTNNFDRAYTTQPARHAEFNINLAFVDMRIAGPRYRGRIAVQYGTSVQANYAGEPTIGHISGPSVSQFIQEATIGYQVSSTAWVDGGIFLAHTGYESWISRDNLTYTRSLMADYSPYYEAGVKLTWQPSAAITAQLAVVNGWQDISKYNTPPAAGIRVDYTVNPSLTLSYDNFVGNFGADTSATQIRFYNDFIAQYNPSSAWQFAAVFDVGTQSHSTADTGTATWYGATFIAKYHATPRVAIVGRVERFADPDQVIVKTGLPSSFETNGASFGADVALMPRMLWRTEVRGYWSSGRVWPAHRPGEYSRDDGFMVTSLALTM
jgi:putative OmpL-like beta-barrel porin-2